jgi:transposase-like protein
VNFRFPREVIAVAVCWYLRYGLSYRDVGELLAERSLNSRPGPTGTASRLLHRAT